MSTPATPPPGDVWDKARRKTFTHPFDPHLLTDRLPRSASVLDYGCGYGRLSAPLARAGLSVVGMDPSAALVARGLEEHPKLDLRVWPGGPLPFADGTFDAAVLFAVLNCIADTREQDAVMAEIRRVLAPDGLLYLSDYPLQPDERNQARYAAQAARFGEFGVFEASGTVFRHHTPERLAELTRGFAALWAHHTPVRTMNGHPAVAYQFLGQTPASPQPAR